jgi:hypothetical protein
LLVVGEAEAEQAPIVPVSIIRCPEVLVEAEEESAFAF